MDDHDELNDFERHIAERMESTAESASFSGTDVTAVYDRAGERARARRTRTTAGLGLAAALLVAMGIGAVAATDDGATEVASDRSTTTSGDAAVTTFFPPDCGTAETPPGGEGGSPDAPNPTLAPSSTGVPVPADTATTISLTGPGRRDATDPSTTATLPDGSTPTTSTTSAGPPPVPRCPDVETTLPPERVVPCARVEPGPDEPAPTTVGPCATTTLPDTTAPPSTVPDTRPPVTDAAEPPNADWPSQLLADLGHGDRVWAVYLAGAGEIDDPVLRQAQHDAEAVGYSAGPGEAGCDQGSTEILGLDASAAPYYVVGLYFASEADARLFADLFAHDEIGLGEVTTLCLD